MLGVLAVTTRGAVSPMAQRERLESIYDVLLKRLARLDDLNDAGAVAHDVYKAKRAELKNQIASVLYQLQAASGKRPKGAKGAGGQHRLDAGGVSGASVAGNERTAP
jgi:hypothetical protein